MDQMATFDISQDDDESDTSQEDLDEMTNVPVLEDAAHAGMESSSSVDLKYRGVFQKWARNELPDTGAKQGQQEPLMFMLLDSDFSIISRTKIDPLVVSILPQNLRSQSDHSYNRLYGVTEQGHSVLINVFGFVPYFYAVPSHPDAFHFQQNVIQELQQALNTEIIKHVQNKLDLIVPYHDIILHSPPILEIQVLNVSDVNIYEFHQPGVYSSNRTEDVVTHAKTIFSADIQPAGLDNGVSTTSTKTDSSSARKVIKIFCRMPKFVWIAVKILQKNLISCRPVVDGQPCPYHTFEGSINHNIRFLTDMNFCGCSWLEISAGNYFHREHNSKLSHCQLEVDVYYKNIIPCPIQLDTIPPLRILSLDIECMTRPPNFTFPRGGVDRVLQIGAILTTYTNGALADASAVMTKRMEMDKFIFMLGDCAEMENTHVFSFENEIEMLNTWRLFVTMTDPDLLMGYNIKKFDIPFLLDRANVIKAKMLPFLGRIKQSECTTRTIKNEAKKPVRYDEKAVNIAGRIIFDMMILIIRHNTKPGRCQLADVAKRYLNSNETKEDVSYKDIFKLQNMGPRTRQILASYCVQDARLPYLIMLQHNPNSTKCADFNTLTYYIDKARTCGTPLRYLVTKSPEYNTYFKVIRKHKNPTVTFVPNTPAKISSGLTPDQSCKRRNSAPPYFTGTVQTQQVAERYVCCSCAAKKPMADAKKFCVRKDLFHKEENKNDNVDGKEAQV